MEKIDKLASGDLAHAIEAHKAYSNISGSISNRMNYIVHFCVEKAGGKLSWWDWKNGGDGDDKAPGDLIHSYSHYTPQSLEISGEWTHGEKMRFIDVNGQEWDLEFGEFPSRWLHENFEEEYVNGLQLYKDKQDGWKKRDKAKKAKAKEELDALIASAKSKLTPEEIRALKKAK